MNLYELDSAWLEITGMMDSGEYAPEVLQDTYDAIQESRELKIENSLKVMLNKRANIDIMKKEINRLRKRISSENNSIEFLKGNVQESLELQEDPRMKTSLFTVWVQNNPPSLKVDDQSQIPLEYFEKQPDKLRKRDLLKDIQEEGVEVEGVEVVQTRGVRFR